MLEKGKKVGEFYLLEKLGSGGFGDVWKAEKRTALDVNYFALKFFRPKEDGVDFDKIGKEIGVWKQLKGLPHIISVIELDRFEDYVYVVSDFADGGSLEKYLKQNGGKARTETEAIQIALEILAGLENLHGKGFVHRDLKPDNVLIMNGRFCLADFGISREIKTHSKATGTAGTMEYMPPEAFEKTPSVTPQTDIWAVGVILQRLLTGALPFPQDEQPSLIAAILMSDADEMPETVSPNLRSIVKKALQKNCENRFKSASEMREVLRDVLKNPQKVVESQTLVFENSDKTAKYEFAPTQKVGQTETNEEKETEIKTAVRRQIKEAYGQVDDELTRQKAVDYQALSNRKTASQTSSKKLKVILIGGIFAVAFLGIIFSIGFYFLFLRSGVKIANSSNNVKTTPNTANENAVANSASKSDRNLPKEIDFKGKMVLVSAGSFTMGSDAGDDISKPAHQVNLPAFYIDRTEVTNAQYKEFCDAKSHPYPATQYWDQNYFTERPNAPVVGISFDDAKAYAAWAGKRLPTEAEWEKAASWNEAAKTKYEFPWGNSFVRSNVAFEISEISDVGKYPSGASPVGALDMAGNAVEWVDAFFRPYPNSTAKNENFGDKFRVVRGGFFNSKSSDYIKTTKRIYVSPDLVANGEIAVFIGFRCALSADDSRLKEILSK